MSMTKQTVGQLIEYLNAYPKDKEVVFATSNRASLYWLSDYYDEWQDCVCVDIGWSGE